MNVPPPLHAALARVPRLYRWLLRTAGRGSPEKHAYLTLVRRGDVVLDVGANEGYFTVLFSHLVGARGVVYAFEPVPPAFERLQRRVARDIWFDNVTLTRAACGDHDGEVTVLVPGDDCGQAALVRHAAGAWAVAAEVAAHAAPLVRLDGFVRAAAPVGLVKIDVEGAELLVLRGLHATLAADQPVVCLELYAEWTTGFGHTPCAVLDELVSLGYDQFRQLDDPRAVAGLSELARRAAAGPINVACGVRARHGSSGFWSGPTA